MNPSTHTTSRINITLAIAAFGLLVYYVVQVNFLASMAWQTRDANDRLTAINDQRNALIAQESALDERSTLTALAAKAGMIPVPANAVVYMVQDHSVAAR